MKKSIMFLLVFAIVLFIPKVYAAEIKTGTYKIHYAHDDSKLLVEKDGNIELGDENSTGITTWNIYSDGNYFYIKSSADNSIILGAEESLRSGTNVLSNDNSNLKYKKWVFDYTGDYYYIRSASSNYNIDVSGGSKNLGANIQLWISNGTLAQKWRLERIDDNPQVLEDGTYMISASNNTNNMIDLSGGKASDSRNVQVYQNNYTWAQLWNIQYDSGYYTINTYLANNKVMDISSGIFKSGSNVQLWSSNGTRAQKWILEQNDDGTYSFSSFDGLWKLDISGGSKRSGANLQIYQTNGTSAQKFKFKKISMDFLENGYYRITTTSGNDLVVGVNSAKIGDGKNVLLTHDNDNRYTKWYIKRLRDDIYKIAIAQNRDKVLDVQGGKSAEGTNVQLFSSNGTRAQQWIVRKHSDGTYQIIGVGSSKTLDVSGGRFSEETNIQIWSSNDTAAQRFNIVPVIQDSYEILDEDKYVIKSYLNQNRVVDVSGAHKDNNTNVQIWSSNDTLAQIWRLDHIGDGKYVIRSMINPNIVLTASASNVVIKKYSDDDDQKWYFYKDENDQFTLYNLGQGKYLYIEGDSIGSNISLSDTQSDKNEVILSQYTKPLKYRGIDVSVHNGNIDWANIRHKVDFVVIRAGYSSEVIENGNDKYQDKKFLRNVENCEKYNIPYALYLYSYAKRVNGSENSAESEAAHMITLLNKIKEYDGPSLSVPIYYDLEDDMTYNAVNYDANTLKNINDTFCSIIENNGYQCGLYTFLYGFGYMGENNVKYLASKYGIWVAHVKWYNFDADEDQFAVSYNPDNRYNRSNFEATYSIKENIWQYSHQGNIPGANTGSGRIDLNIGYNIFD